ncbi:glycosyltransferase family 2 protein [Vibrio sp. TBV020]|uniref:glycosyltransferase family 2 protein n=1 Tax=Vibrio sp. TBV020 TaxID=3137398 RepID=UPI0038CD3E55
MKESCWHSDIPICDPNSHSQIIVSLTTYSSRINSAYVAIESIAYQSVKAESVILWLDQDEFDASTLPETIKRQMIRGLQVRFVPNFGSYKKLFPAVEAFPEKHIVTIDDDIIYPEAMLADLLKQHQAYPKSIIACRAHAITRNSEGIPTCYHHWRKEVSEHCGENTFVTTGGGTFFPADESRLWFVNKELAMTLCPNADDVWVNYIAKLHSIEVRKLESAYSYRERFTFLTHKNNLELKTVNVLGGLNDKYLHNMFQYFGFHL